MEQRRDTEAKGRPSGLSFGESLEGGEQEPDPSLFLLCGRKQES